MRSARQLTDELVLASGNHFHCLVDVRAECIRWTARGGVEAAALLPDRVRLCRAGSGGLEIASLATGATLAAWAAPYVRQIVPAADGTIATLSAGVVRVWDPALAARAPARLLAMDGDTPAQLSPDETRLVTGRVLCDARTGALLAILDVRAAPWLDGIRFDYQCLTDGGFAEILPFSPGFRLWSSRDGSLLVSDPAAHLLDVGRPRVRSLGAKYAVIPNAGFGGRHLRVHDLRSGALVLALDDVRPASDGWRFALGFSPDGAHLWWETDAGDRFVLPYLPPGRPPSPPPRPAASPRPSPLPRSPEPPPSTSPAASSPSATRRSPTTTSAPSPPPTAAPSPTAPSHYVLEDPDHRASPRHCVASARARNSTAPRASGLVPCPRAPRRHTLADDRQRVPRLGARAAEQARVLPRRGLRDGRGSPRHNALCARIIALAIGALPRCTVLTSDQRVTMASGGRYSYPDVSVVVEELQIESGDVLTNSDHPRRGPVRPPPSSTTAASSGRATSRSPRSPTTSSSRRPSRASSTTAARPTAPGSTAPPAPVTA